MRARAILLCLLALSIFLLAVTTPKMAAQYPQPGPERVYAIKAGKLVDPEKGTTETNQIIVVRGKTIEAVGANVPIPADAKVIDLTKSTVLPGLFDAHSLLAKARIPGATLEINQIRDLVLLVDKAAEWREISLHPPDAVKEHWRGNNAPAKLCLHGVLAGEERNGQVRFVAENETAGAMAGRKMPAGQPCPKTV